MAGHGATRQQAAAKSSDYGVLPREPLKTSSLANGMLVASVENQSPLSQRRHSCQALAGGRYETPENRGVTHLLRIVAGLSNAEDTAFGLTRQLQQVGGSLTCTVDREVLIYSADATRNHMDLVMKLLANAATKQVFKPWEVQDNKARVQLDLKLTAPEVSLLEDLHLAAFRQSDLGHSLLAAPHALGSLGTDQLASHLSQTLLSRRVAVVGTGVDHDTLTQFAQSLQLPDGDGPARAARYGGGEARGLLGAAAASAGGAAAALGATYPDVGLVGYTVVAEASQAGKAVEAVNKAFKTASLTAEDVSRGKALVKAALLRADDNSGTAVESMGVQGASLGAVTSVEEAVKAVDAVKLADVQTLHKKLVGGKLSMAARGNLQHVPYLDQL
ncbi:cytochrome b-c1 complex subunit 2, mitochondrial-like [Pollicipes pollicipes]|uniref:cytochrome b-c1 complex subunit 2, mitochondrial-like n=1 Tax=Pollicipes pollicipes TaxID=41117 RepID=UPI00188573EA|nr:cytochrome b-c1 complex subunit 2, mitochondrial-like [Pollicipes pollicipes]